MSTATWSGPWCHVETVTGSKHTHDPVPLRAPALPAGLCAASPVGGSGGTSTSSETVRVLVVRWRVNGSNPLKSTFKAAASIQAQAFARTVAAAALTGAAPDERGRPFAIPALGQHVPARPSAGQAATCVSALAGSALEGASTEDAASEPAASNAPGLPAVLAVPVQGPHPPTPVPGTLPPESPLPLSTIAAAVDGHGLTIGQYAERLKQTYGARWRDSRTWDDYTLQLKIVTACYLYGPADDRIDTHGVTAGSSIHFSLLRSTDFEQALLMRQCTDLGAKHRNNQRREKYARDQATYARKLAAFTAGSGPRGRRPTLPTEPATEREFTLDATNPLIKTATEKQFRTAQSMLFDRAHDEGLNVGPNLWRLWNPRGSGGPRGNRSTPFRRVPKTVVDARLLPPVGFLVDLGDTMASCGSPLPGTEFRTGERYLIQPLTGWQTVCRPGELANMNVSRITFHEANPRYCHLPNPGGHLKGRAADATRTVPVGALLQALIRAHLQDGLHAADSGLLFPSPLGYELTPANFLAKFFRPSVASLIGPAGTWAEYRNIKVETRMMRKSGITSLLEYGQDTRVIASWAGHDEHELFNSYRGVIDVVRGQRTWVSTDHMVEAALRDNPPRGNGKLAKVIRNWLAGISMPAQ